MNPPNVAILRKQGQRETKAVYYAQDTDGGLASTKSRQRKGGDVNGKGTARKLREAGL